MYGHTQDVFTATRKELGSQLDLATSQFTETQRSLANAIAGASMANLNWKSDISPNAERKWELPKVAIEVAEILTRAATTNTVRQGEISEAEFRAFVASPKLRKIADDTKLEVTNLLEQRARGR